MFNHILIHYRLQSHPTYLSTGYAALSALVTRCQSTRWATS